MCRMRAVRRGRYRVCQEPHPFPAVATRTLQQEFHRE